MENDERISWPMESITLTKTELLDLVIPTIDAAINFVDEHEPISMLSSDLVEVLGLILDRLERP